MVSEDEQELIKRAKEGDHRAFQTLVERHQRKAYTVAYGVLRDQDAAIDATQDAFVKVFKSLPNFHGQSSFYTWLYRIVINVCIDKKRKAARSVEVEYDDSYMQSTEEPVAAMTLASTQIDTPEQAYARSELRRQMGAAMDTLSTSHRQILVLREVQGMSYDELAETLELPRGTVMSRLFHARKKFQHSLNHYLKT